MRLHFFYEDCIDELQLDKKKLFACTNGSLGTILQLFAEKETLKVMDKLEGVPAVVYQKQPDHSDFTLSLSNFSSVVGNKLAANYNNQNKFQEK